MIKNPEILKNFEDTFIRNEREKGRA